jgi:SAM-dependent methyltransferase
VPVLNPLDAVTSDPWGTLRLVLGDPLHPGGEAATAALLDRAGVGPGTRLLDVGCGAGGALDLARDRGADATGLDHDPRGPGTVRGDLASLPFRDDCFDVALAECVLCLADLVRGLAEARRVLAPGGRLALSDVVVEGDLPALPPTLAEALCLSGDRGRDRLLRRVDAAGFTVEGVESHREDLLALRDRARNRVDYAGLLRAFGDRGQRLLAGVETLERAVDDGRVGYVSLVARAD